AGDDVAAVDPDADRDADAVLAFETRAQRARRALDLERGPHRAYAVVLVGDRRTEHGHDGVADVLVDRPAVALDGACQDAEVRPERVAQLIGREFPAERLRRNDVGEEDR